MPANVNARRQSTFRWQTGLILVLATAVYLIGNERVSLWDRDEPRYAQTSRQMLQSGDWVVPRFLGEIRTAKPIFIYWCQSTAMKIFGDTAFAARFPSAIAMLLTIAFLAIVLRRHIGRTRTMLAVLILASSALSIAAAKMCLTDAVLLLWITIAQACLFAIIYRRAGWITWIVMGIAIGCAGLTKGPVVLGVVGMTILVLIVIALMDRRSLRIPSINLLKLLVAFAIVAAICAPWLILVHRRAPEFLPRIIGHDVVDRIKSGLEGHKGPPGFYLLTIWGTYFPWSLFLPGAIIYGWQHRRNTLVRFALASVIGPWVMFEIVQTKLVHYMLPVFPWLALLTARAIALESARFRRKRRANAPRDTSETIFLGIVIGFCALVVLITVTLLLVTVWRGEQSARILPAIIIALLGAETARSTFLAWRARKPRFAACVIGVGVMLILGVFYGFYLPHVQQLQTSRRVAQVLLAEHATQPGSVIMMDYKEPSLAFYQGGTIREESNNSFLKETNPLLWPRWIVMTRQLWTEQPTDIRARFEIFEDPIAGWWYANRMRSVEVMILRKRS